MAEYDATTAVGSLSTRKNKQGYTDTRPLSLFSTLTVFARTHTAS